MRQKHKFQHCLAFSSKTPVTGNAVTAIKKEGCKSLSYFTAYTFLFSLTLALAMTDTPTDGAAGELQRAKNSQRPVARQQ